MSLSFFVQGRPAAQGSKRHVGGGRLVEASKYIGPWRQVVTAAAIETAELEGWECLSDAAEVDLEFHIARPNSVKEVDRPLPVKPPDLDKLVRGVLDALTDAGVWDDDGLIVNLTARKRYVSQGEDGVSIRVKSFEVN